MELRRKCGSHIQDWYYNSGKALLVTGARQVGKTHLIRSVLAEMQCDFVEINLIETPAAVMIAPALAGKARVFSIGTNDLTQ